MEPLFETADIHRPTPEAEIGRAEALLGMSFPPSYKAFCRRYGLGMVGRLYMLAVPLEDPHLAEAVTHRVPLMKARVADSKAMWREDGMIIGEDVWEGADDPGLVDRAAFFGTSENGEEIFWDVSGSGEHKIYVDCRGTIRFGGNSLDEFVRRCQTEEIKSVFGPGYAPAPSLFEGRAPRVRP